MSEIQEFENINVTGLDEIFLSELICTSKKMIFSYLNKTISPAQIVNALNIQLMSFAMYIANKFEIYQRIYKLHESIMRMRETEEMTMFIYLYLIVIKIHQEENILLSCGSCGFGFSTDVLIELGFIVDGEIIKPNNYLNFEESLMIENQTNQICDH
jgi:hypothetical protein